MFTAEERSRDAGAVHRRGPRHLGAAEVHRQGQADRDHVKRREPVRQKNPWKSKTSVEQSISEKIHFIDFYDTRSLFCLFVRKEKNRRHCAIPSCYEINILLPKMFSNNLFSSDALNNSSCYVNNNYNNVGTYCILRYLNLTSLRIEPTIICSGNFSK
jgi:hypothetical protein